MTTVRTVDGDSGRAVQRQMDLERRLRRSRRKPSTVVSEEAVVEGASSVGGPNPNDEGKPVRPAPEYTEQSEEATEATDDPQDDDSNDGEPEPEAVERPDSRFGSKDGWYAYRLANGYTADELEGKGRNDLRDLEDR